MSSVTCVCKRPLMQHSFILRRCQLPYKFYTPATSELGQDSLAAEATAWPAFKGLFTVNIWLCLINSLINIFVVTHGLWVLDANTLSRV